MPGVDGQLGGVRVQPLLIRPIQGDESTVTMTRLDNHDLGDVDPDVLDVDLIAEDLHVEELAATDSLFCTAASFSCAASASCPVGTASTIGSFSSSC